jgi:hypothetical protein
MAKQKTKPHPIKAGRGIRAKVWKNNGKKGDWFNVEIVRTYEDDKGELQDSTSFSRDDLLHVAYAAEKAFEYIHAQANKPDEEDGDE